jgi:hypothetical protein
MKLNSGGVNDPRICLDFLELIELSALSAGRFLLDKMRVCRLISARIRESLARQSASLISI